MEPEITALLRAALVRAESLIGKYEHETALTFCTQVLKIDDKNADAWYLAGVCHAVCSRPEEAKRCFSAAVEHATDERNREFARQKINEI